MSSVVEVHAPGVQIRPIGDALGAEVTGLDVSAPLDGATLATIQDAFLAHHLLCFRDQHLDPQQQVAFSGARPWPVAARSAARSPGTDGA